MKIRPLDAADRSWVQRTVAEYFGSPRIVSRGVLYESASLPGLVAERDGEPVGLLQYSIERDECQVVVLIAAVRRQGIGRALLGAVQPVARAAGCRRLWLVTIRNNHIAVSFYGAIGWRQVAVHRGAARLARRLKPGMPEIDAQGEPIEDEIEFELSLEGA